MNDSPEAIRRAMLEVRRWDEGTLDDFNRRLAIAQEELAPDSDSDRLGTETDLSELL